jgi:glutamate synthase (NADPH/NADH) small chain
MGKVGAFLEISRVEAPERDPRLRTHDFHEFVETLPVGAPATCGRALPQA